MLGNAQTNDAYGNHCLPKSIGNKSVNRLRAIAQTLRASRGGEGGRAWGYWTFKSEKELLSRPFLCTGVVGVCSVLNLFWNDPRLPWYPIQALHNRCDLSGVRMSQFLMFSKQHFSEPFWLKWWSEDSRSRTLRQQRHGPNVDINSYLLWICEDQNGSKMKLRQRLMVSKISIKHFKLFSSQLLTCRQFGMSPLHLIQTLFHGWHFCLLGIFNVPLRSVT